MRHPSPAAARSVLALAVSASLVAVSAGSALAAKNIFLLVADGAGYNTWLASSYYDGTYGKEFHDRDGWVHLAVSTYPLRAKAADPDRVPPEELQDPSWIYDPDLAWGAEPLAGRIKGYPVGFTGYRWLRRAPDSANTATAMATGRKTYIGAINVDGYGRPITDTIVARARAAGRRIGIVTSVPLCHATPAAIAGVSAPSRKLYCSLGLQMLLSGTIDVLGGCGNPSYDKDGRRREQTPEEEYDYVGGRRVWEELNGAASLKPGDRVGGFFPGQGRDLSAAELEQLRSWTLLQTREEIEAHATGDVPAKLLMIPQVSQTLQQERSCSGSVKEAAPGEDPLLETVPSLEAMTRVALNSLEEDPDGFFLHVEGGAVDWAMHGNQMGRMIEEMTDFKAAVDAVIDWVERNGGWEENLVLVTADHDHLLWGPDSDRTAFAPLTDEGKGNMPGYRWLFDYHSNSLVPLYARGAGAEQLFDHAGGFDPRRDAYLHEVEIFSVMADALED